ncbi:MAG: cobalamin-binding protein [Archaeoglobales archaeon]|nr:cobalamin-binding protein [Archaeoglobales archaeon]
MKRWLILCFLTLIALFPLCVSDKEVKVNGETNVTVTTENVLKIMDDTGYAVEIKKVPERIVSLAPSNTEILFAIGAWKQVVGVTDYCNYPPEVLELRKAGKIQTVGGYTTVSIERVVALKPDLVLAAYGNGMEIIERMRELNLTVVGFDPKTISDVAERIIIIGKLTGHEEEAKKLVDEMTRKIEAVKKAVAGKERLKVVHIVWHDPIYVSGKNTFIDELIEISGVKNVFDFDGWRVVSVENLIAANPDVIIVSSGTGMGGGENVSYKWVINEPLLKNTNAVKNGRVYVVDADIISRPSYRLADAAVELARLIHGVKIEN